MEKRPKLVILQAKKPVNLQLFFTVYIRKNILLLVSIIVRWHNFLTSGRSLTILCIDGHTESSIFTFLVDIWNGF